MKLFGREQKQRESLFSAETYSLKSIDELKANRYVQEYVGLAIFVLVGSAIFAAINGDGLSYIFDAILVLLFSVGIYLRMRSAAILFFVYFIGAHFLLLFQNPKFIGSGFVVFLVLVALAYKGILGTIKLHQLQKEKERRNASENKAASWFEMKYGARYPICWKGWVVYFLLIVSAIPTIGDILQLSAPNILDGLSAVADDASVAFVWMAALIALIKFKTYPGTIKSKLPSKKLLYVNAILALSALYWCISIYLSSGLQSPFALAVAILPLTIIYLNVMRAPEAVPINLFYFAYLFSLIVQAIVPYLDTNSSIATASGAGAAPTLYLTVFSLILILFSSPLVLAAVFLLQRKTRDLFRGTAQTAETPTVVG